MLAMRVPHIPPLSSLVVASIAILLATLGVALRLEDPLSSPAIGAEDPYTHIVFTKEALERGYFGDSVHLGTSLYPPGIHAFTGAFAPLAGVSLYDFARFAPAVLGGIAVLGMFVLGSRLGGHVAGIVAALVTAVMPEHIFRSNLLFPTAFDLALLPAYVLAFHLATRTVGAPDTPPWRSPTHAGAAALFLGMSVPLAFLHPWAVPLFAAPLGLYAAVRALRRDAASPARVRVRVAWAAGMLIAATAFAMASRWTESDTGFADFFAALPLLSILSRLALPGALLFAVLVVIFATIAAPAVWLVGALARSPDRPTSRSRRVARRVGAAAMLLGVLALARNPPEGVSYFDNFGYVPAVLALAGVWLAFTRPSRVSDMGLALGAVLFPLTAVDLFDSPYWPQRTVAYLSLAVALLAATAACAAVLFVRMRVASSRWSVARAAPSAATALVLVIVGSAVAADPAESYDWYRLYEDEHFEGFEELASWLNEDEDARAIVYSWQPGLVLKALADPAQVRYSPSFYADGSSREKVLDESDDAQYVVVDTHAREGEEEGKADLGFLHDGRYHVVLESADGRFEVWKVSG